MRLRLGLPLVGITFLLTLLVSCSGGNSPLTPGPDNELTQHKVIDSATNESRVLWGYWSVNIDQSTGSVEIIPLRGAMFNANVTMFMQPPISPVNLLKIHINPASDLPNGLVDVDVTLEHPFKSLPIYRGFDVRGIFMANGSETVLSVPGLHRAAPDEAMVLNPDGYTRWWNPSEFGPIGKIFGFQYGKLGFPYKPTATLNPYKYFADDLDPTSGVETMTTSNRGTFSTNPGLNKRNYVIQFTMSGGNPEFKFQYAVDASWDPPDPSFAPDYPIEAFNENAQMREPYHIEFWDTGSTAWYEGPSNYGGELNLAIEVFDWQTPSAGQSDQISALYLESPIFGGAVDVFPVAIDMPGSQPTSMIYSVVMGNLTLTKSGDEEVLIAVESAFGTYEPNTPGGDAFIFPPGPLVSFTLSDVTILGEEPNNPPVAVADETWPLLSYAPMTVHLDPAGSYDPDPGDSITLYEWDIDADGTYEYNNTDGSVIDHVFATPGTYDVQLRVTDSFALTDLLDVPLTVEVAPGEDSWPMGFYDAQNTCYNPYSHVRPPLQIVWDEPHAWNSLSMMTVGQDRVFQTDSNGYLRVLDFASGLELWSKNIKTFGSYWTGCSAALWNNDVVIGGSGIHSFDIDSQVQNWHVYTATSFDHQGQVVVGDTIYFKGSQDSLVSIDAVDGSENWSVPWTDVPLFPPVYGEISGQGYVAAPYGYSVRCVNASNGAQVWDQPIGGPCYHNPVVIGDYVYFGYYTLYKKHLSSGTNAAVVDLGNYAPLGMWISDDAIYLTARNHTAEPDLFKLYKFDFDLDEQWSIDVPYNAFFGVYSSGYVWLAGLWNGTDFQLRAFDADDGSVAYTDPTTFTLASGGISNLNNKLVLADNYGRTICFEMQ